MSKFFPNLGSQYTRYPVTGKSAWSNVRNENYINIQNIQFNTIISGISLPPCMILDQYNNLYITIDGNPNQLLKYTEKNGKYINVPFVSDDTWLYGGGSGKLPTTPVAMTFSQNFDYMYVVNFTNNCITVIDMTTYGTQTLNITNSQDSVGYRLKAPNGMTFDSNFEYMIVTNITDHNLVKITLTSPYEAIIEPFNANVPFTQPILITVDNKNNFYVSDLSVSQIIKVSYLNNSSYKVIASSPYINQPRGVSFNSNNYNKLWITNLNSLTPIFSIGANGNNTIVNRLNSTLFNNPRGVIFDKYGYMYISNFGSTTNIGSILKSTYPVYDLIY